MNVPCKCKDATCSGKPGVLHPKVAALADWLTDAGCVITSGVRCPAHNAAEGGEKTSKHLIGEALDFVPQDRMGAVVALLAQGTWRCITYQTDNHVHVQLATEPRLYVKAAGAYARAL